MSESGMSDVERVTLEYYDSHDADTYYRALWGGEDLHLGVYDAVDEAVRPASDRTTARIMSKLALAPAAAVVDLGAGYGGSARMLAKRHGCRVACYNLSSVENRRNAELCQAAGVAGLVTVAQGSFDGPLPFGAGSADCVWSQDAFLHSADRAHLLREAYRILKPGGDLIFTDPMQADGTDPANLKAVFARLPVPNLGSFQYYKDTASEIGLRCVSIDVLTPHLRTHYSRILDEVLLKERELRELGVSEEYVERQKTGLKNWVDAADRGWLAWGILHFQKPGVQPHAP